MRDLAQPDDLLIPGQTCWRIERATRLRVIVDAAEYFRAAKAAMLRARWTIMLIGWDFDTRIKFEPEGATLEGPETLGDFLAWLPEHRPELQVRLLKWDLGMLQTLGRGMTPIFITNWLSHRRLTLRLDCEHPVGAAHHQKLLVIDDQIAFCGGIDMTADRWDTDEHLDGDSRRVKPNGKPYKPWHDATTAVEGPVARALGDVARERWFRATGERLDPPPEGDGVWPDDLAPTLEDVDVGIARTLPKMNEREEIREIEALYLAAIAQAKHVLYIESQYLASRKIAEALARRLREPKGPEIVLVLPKDSEGWLARKAMDGARAKLLRLLWAADLHGRFGAYYPVTQAGEAIYVHAKIMVVDDRLLRLGSSNLNNRSLGYDTECDLAMDAAQDPTRETELRASVLAIRRDFVREHLGVAAGRFEAALEAASGSLRAAIEALRGDGRSLRPFTASDLSEDESALAENELLDPERPAPDLARRLREAFGELLRAWRAGKA